MSIVETTKDDFAAIEQNVADLMKDIAGAARALGGEFTSAALGTS